MSHRPIVPSQLASTTAFFSTFQSALTTDFTQAKFDTGTPTKNRKMKNGQSITQN
jgi:hypothetical protein